MEESYASNQQRKKEFKEGFINAIKESDDYFLFVLWCIEKGTIQMSKDVTEKGRSDDIARSYLKSEDIILNLSMIGTSFGKTMH